MQMTRRTFFATVAAQATASADEIQPLSTLFRVGKLLHNDDFTTMEFVVFVLQYVFNKNDLDAFSVMLKVHNEGVGIAGIYPYEIAKTKSEKTMNLARAREYPLLCTVEAE